VPARNRASGIRPCLVSGAAENDLQVYYKSFSFDKLKSELVKEKDKYFAALRDILGKNMFTTYKTNDNFILGILLLATI
jgi:hypothetical protein